MKEQDQSVVIFSGQSSSDGLAGALESAGLSVCRVDSAMKLPQALRKHMPATLVVDLTTEENALAGLDSIKAALDDAKSSPRMIVLSDRADQEIRLRAVQAGSNVFLTQPVNPRMLMQYLDPAFHAAGDHCRVLVIAENRDLLAGKLPVLRDAGMEVKLLKNPAHTLLKMINFSPDLLLIEHPLSGSRGDDIGRMIHQLADYEDMPVIYVFPDGSEESVEARDTTLAAYVPAAVNAGDLMARIRQLVQESRERQARIHYLQNCDQTSGLLNRRGFFNLLQRGVRPADAAALILLELENLQHNYPQLSPHELNELVIQVTAQLGRLTRSSVAGARIGDYVFAFLVDGKTGDDFRKLGQVLSHAISSRIYDVGKHSVTLGCSIGIAVTRQALEDGMPLFPLVVSACEEARHAGDNRVSLRLLGSTGDSREYEQLVMQIRDALEHGRFRLVYQPIVALRGNSVEKYEVLLRMYDVDSAVIPPSRFVPVAEKSGLMGLIDRWVVEQSVRTLKEKTSGISLFIKISSNSMQDPEFTNWLKDCLDEHGISGEKLVFEVRQANISSGMRSAAEFVKRVKQLGCDVALEHHNISHDVTLLFEHVPASYVKIDGNAIIDFAENPERRRQLDTIIREAEKKGAQVIAGFVENASSLHLLWQSGVHYIQGNFLQEPAEALDFDFGGESSA